MTWVWFLGNEESVQGVESWAAIGLRAEQPLARAVVMVVYYCWSVRASKIKINPMKVRKCTQNNEDF